MLKTPLCSMLGIELPIFSAGMGPIAGPELVAAVSNAGGLGVLGCTSMSPEEIRAVIRRTYELTDKPFGVDLILPARIDQSGTKMSDVADLIPEEHKKAAKSIAEELGVNQTSAVSNMDRNALGTDAEAQIEVVMEENVPVFVGALGSPGFIAKRLQDAGVVVMSVVGNTKQAVSVVKDGAEVVIAQGTEGGGHTGHVGTIALLPQVLDAVDVPVVAAGGIGDGRGLAAALVMGCQAVWVGTRFLATEEAGIQGWQKAGIVAAADQSPVISRSYTGKRFRMLPNKWTKAWEDNELDPLPMPLQPVLTGMTIGPLATDRGGKEGISMNGAGNIAGLIDSILPASEVVAQLASEAETCIAGLSSNVPQQGEGQ
ncbi:MAG: nitronate monooxygenase [Acidimicrobiales bacterium]|nr:nitronate monooxygenase [Acidimicrobiales bacterium]